MRYTSRGGIARIWVEMSLLRASFATIIRSCQYMVAVDSSNIEAFIAKGILSSISISFTLTKCFAHANFLKGDDYLVDSYSNGGQEEESKDKGDCSEAALFYDET